MGQASVLNSVVKARFTEKTPEPRLERSGRGLQTSGHSFQLEGPGKAQALRASIPAVFQEQQKASAAQAEWTWKVAG